MIATRGSFHTPVLGLRILHQECLNLLVLCAPIHTAPLGHCDQPKQFEWTSSRKGILPLLCQPNITSGVGYFVTLCDQHQIRRNLCISSGRDFHGHPSPAVDECIGFRPVIMSTTVTWLETKGAKAMSVRRGR